MESSAVQAVKVEPCEDEDVCIFPTEEPTAVFLNAQKADDDVCVKHEPRCDGVLIKTDPSCSDVCIKELGSAAAELYSDHVVKDELVVGPVLVERRDQAPTVSNLAIEQEQSCKIVSDILRRDSRVTLRRILVDMLTGTQSTDRDTPRPTHGADVEHKTSGFRNIKRTNKGQIPQERPSTRPSYKCDNCKYVTGIQSSLTRHMKTHSENKRHKCDQCSYASKYKYCLLAHIRKHRGEKPYKCEQCSYASHVKGNLSAHLRKHTGDKRYKCDQCSYACYHKNELLKHVTKHTGEKPYKCEQCSYASNFKGNLSAHLRKHTGYKRYKCDQCSYACYYKNELLKHVRKHIKTYICHHCDYASTNKCNLIVHIRNHTAELPYKCGQCGYASRRKCYLQKHQCGQYSYGGNTSNRESSPPDLAVVRKPEGRCYVNKRRALRLTVGESQDRAGEGRIVEH